MCATTADWIAQNLALRGVRHVFGMPGGASLPLLEAFRVHGIETVLVRHEGSAGFMADAVYQLTGQPGACLSTLGPGATNLVSGVAGAMLERSRVLAITGQCGTDLRGIYTHQILDHEALFRPVAKHVVALRPGVAGVQVATAMRHLDQGMPGPVVLDVPADVAGAEQAQGWVEAPKPPMAGLDQGALERGAGLLAQAQRPVMLVGIGDLSDAAADAVGALSSGLSVPVLSTYRAKGIVDERGPWCAGAFGLSPVVDALQQGLLARADLILAVGLDPVELRSNWLPGWPRGVPVVLLDPVGQPDLAGPVAVDVRGPVPSGLDALRAQVVARGRSQWTIAELARHRSALAAPFADGPDGPGATVAAVQAGAPDDVIVAFDVGAHRITASHVWQCVAPRTQLQSNGFSSMATALPMAIAAKLSLPERPVLALTGDMGLWMALGELGLVQERGMDLVVVYLADRALSLIALKQERAGLAENAVGFANPDVVHLAAAFGGTGVRVQGALAVKAAVETAFAAGGLHIIEAQIDPAGYRRQM